MRTFVTFGQTHTHSINGKTFDKDCVAVVNGDREEVRKLFGDKFSVAYHEQDFDPKIMTYFPRGYITVN
jgi:hypothetical protein